MQTPGQLVRLHRTRRAWSQRELAEQSGFSQPMISRFENELTMPTWDQLCRVLAPMGVQPTVEGEECDITQHYPTRGARQSWREWSARSATSWDPRWPDVDPDRVVRPDLQRSELSPWDVAPVSCFLAGLDAIVIGPFALRIHGYPCTVSSVDIDLYGHDPDAPLSEFAELLALRMERQQIELWSPEAMRYLTGPPPDVVADCILRTGGRLRLRTTATGTGLQLSLRPGHPPRHFRAHHGGWTFKVLAISEFDESQPWVQRVIRDWVGHDRGSWPGGPPASPAGSDRHPVG